MKILLRHGVEWLLALAFPPRETEKVVQSLSAEALGTRMRPTYIGVVGLAEGRNTATALFSYRIPEVVACIGEAKFHDNARTAQLLGQALGQYLTTQYMEHIEQIEHSIIVPIPLSRARLRERGYNQTERIAKEALRALAPTSASIELNASLLIRTWHTPPQTKLSGRERRQNLRGAFAPTRICDPLHTYIVFDDVITTGSTLVAAHEALYHAGATRILLLALAHADLM